MVPRHRRGHDRSVTADQRRSCLERGGARDNPALPVALRPARQNLVPRRYRGHHLPPELLCAAGAIDVPCQVMRTLRRIALAVTAIALLAGLALGSTSLRAEVLEYKPPPSGDQVNCGSVFSGSEWAGDEGCDGVRMHRFGYVVMSFFLAFIFGIISAVLVFTHVRGMLHGSTARA